MYILHLYYSFYPRVTATLLEATSRMYISFDGWTTKGGKRSFFSIVAHFADAFSTIRDMAVALP